MTDTITLTALNTRIWYVEGGVHPLRSPVLLTMGKFSTDPSQRLGEAKRITAPDPKSFSKDIEVGSVPAASERATFAIGIRSTTEASVVLNWAKKGCRVDIIAISGKCGNPQDFTNGGEKWLYMEDGQLSGHNYSNLGAFGRDEDNPTTEQVDMTAADYYEWLPMVEEKVGTSVTVRQIMTVDVYRGSDCEDCPDPCDRVLASMAGASATPGTQPILLYSADGGVTWSQQTISTLFSNEEVMDGEIIGGLLVYISETSNSIHWTDIEQVYLGTNTWVEATTGFVAGKGPRAITSVDARHTWICGASGYLYFCANPKTGVVVQDAGILTVQNYNSISAFDQSYVLAVGNSNVVSYTRDGGEVWQSVTGPAVGINLGACWMWDKDTWLVGEGAGGNGKLWVTDNSGVTWTQIVLPITTIRIDKIKFISDAEGYMLARDGGKSYILRTITAGNEWVVLPQGKAGTPIANSSLGDLAVCSKYANIAYAGGLATGGALGIIVKASA